MRTLLVLLAAALLGGCYDPSGDEVIGRVGYPVSVVTDTTRGVVCYVYAFKGISCVADVVPAAE